MRTRAADAKEAALQLQKAAAWLAKVDEQHFMKSIQELEDLVQELRTSLSED